MDMSQPPLPYRFAKRAFDLCVAIVLLPVAVPMCLLMLVAIRLESPGSPLFMQQRVGRDLEPFTMLKLRTMRSDTKDVASHLVGKAQITRLGRILRKLKLDELPQLANVLAGSMSLVGPRPCLPSQTELIDERNKRGVFAVRPGVTGAAQVAGIDMSEPARLAEAESAYLERASFGGDLAIIARTVSGGGRGDAATRQERGM